MRPTPSIPLADAFLALSDDGAPAAPRPRRRAAAAAAAAVILALGGPLGWWVTDRPLAALSAKISPAAEDE